MNLASWLADVIGIRETDLRLISIDPGTGSRFAAVYQNTATNDFVEIRGSYPSRTRSTWLVTARTPTLVVGTYGPWKRVAQGDLIASRPIENPYDLVFEPGAGDDPTTSPMRLPGWPARLLTGPEDTDLGGPPGDVAGLEELKAIIAYIESGLAALDEVAQLEPTTRDTVRSIPPELHRDVASWWADAGGDNATFIGLLSRTVQARKERRSPRLERLYRGLLAQGLVYQLCDASDGWPKGSYERARDIGYKVRSRAYADARSLARGLPSQGRAVITNAAGALVVRDLISDRDFRRLFDPWAKAISSGPVRASAQRG